jgi:hypothetical protein
MSRRTWRWLRVRITALLARPPAIVDPGMGSEVIEIPSTRFGLALNPPSIGT